MVLAVKKTPPRREDGGYHNTINIMLSIMYKVIYSLVGSSFSQSAAKVNIIGDILFHAFWQFCGSGTICYQ
jgi:hypothetical protein